MPKIITISSHVAYGAVGNRIAVPVLERLGITAIAVSTVNLPWHPGMNAVFGQATRFAPDDMSFSSMMQDLSQAPWLGKVDGVMSGYLGRTGQASAIARLVAALKEANPSALYLCDPVIGDKAGLYVSQETAVALREHLWPLADIVTPNMFEFGWMTGQTTLDPTEMIKTAKALQKGQVLITSAPVGSTAIGNLLITADSAEMVHHQNVPNAPNGTGDMLAAMYFGWIIKGETASAAIKKAVSSVINAINAAQKSQSQNLSPEQFWSKKGDLTEEIFVEQFH